MHERLSFEREVIELGLGKDRTGFAGPLQFGRATDRAGFSDELITLPNREFERETKETPQAANCRKKWEAFIGSLPEEVRTALAANDFDLAVITAIHSGLRDINKLADMLFFRSWGQTRGYCRISPNERDPAGKKMADWRTGLRQKHVFPALKQPSPKLPQAGGILCIERAVRPAKAAPEAPTIDLTGTYEQQRPGKAPREVVRINQAGTHIECLFRRVSKPSDTAPGQTAFLFGDRQEDGSYYLFSARNPRTLVLLKPAGSGILLKAGTGQSTLQLMDADAAHLLPTLGNYADELVRLHEQRPISHAQLKHLVEGLNFNVEHKVEGYRTAYRNLTGIDLGAPATAAVEQQVQAPS